jgi:hypothetical protein
MKPVISLTEILDYEVRASWWMREVSWPWAQALAGRYLAWKVKRKWYRYVCSRLMKDEIKAMREAIR